MVAATKSTGSGHLVWPKGLTAEDVPAELICVINHALLIVSWQENLPSEEIPKYWMWHLDWEVEEWFVEVKRKRDLKYGSTSEEVDESGEPLYGHNQLFDDFGKD